jgi:hypothetical protein
LGAAAFAAFFTVSFSASGMDVFPNGGKWLDRADAASVSAGP